MQEPAEQFNVDMCRICMGAMKIQHDIFEHTLVDSVLSHVYDDPEQECAQYGELKLCDIFAIITAVDVDPGDGLPPGICHDCERRVVDAFLLRALASRSNDALCELRDKHNVTRRIINDEQQQHYEESILPDDGIEIIVLSKKSADRENVELYDVHSLQQQPKTKRRSQAAARKQIVNCPAADYEITYTEDTIIEMTNESIDPEDVRLYDVQSLQELPTTNRRSPAAERKQIDKCPTADYDIIEISASVVSDVAVEEVEEEEEDGVSFLLNTLQQTNAENPEAADLDLVNPVKPVRTKRRRLPTDATTKATAATGDEKRKHMCSICDRSFMRKSNLVDHLRLHANVRPHECEVCKQAFVQIGNLRAHMRVHTKERPYQCDVCNKTYNQSGALKVHMRVHTNERNYKCAECDKAFTNSSDRNKHQRVHDQSAQIECHLCDDRKFAQRVNYLLHMRKYHSGEVPAATGAAQKKQKK